MKTQTGSIALLIAQVLAALFLFSYAVPAFAAFPSGGSGGFPSSGSGSQTITNPAKAESIGEFVALILRAVMAIGIPIAIIFIVLAGFKFITAQGSPQALAEARSNFVYTVIGIAIFIGASALAELVMATLRQIGVNV
jgi:hypothetical protein